MAQSERAYYCISMNSDPYKSRRNGPGLYPQWEGQRQPAVSDVWNR